MKKVQILLDNQPVLDFDVECGNFGQREPLLEEKKVSGEVSSLLEDLGKKVKTREIGISFPDYPVWTGGGN